MRPQTSISQLSVPPSAYWPDRIADGRGRDGAAAAAAARAALRGRAGIADRRIERRLALADQRDGLAIGRFGDPEILVGDIDLRGELIERRIAVHAPPLAAIDRVARDGGAEVRVAGLLELGRRRRRRLRPLVVGTDQATASNRNGKATSRSSSRTTVMPRLHPAHRPRQPAVAVAVAAAEAVEIDVDHRRRIEGQDLADHQAADDRDAERLAQLRAVAEAQRQRQRAQHRRHGRHQDRAEAQQAGLVDRLARLEPFVPLALQRHVDHHDGVLLHDADQQQHADHGDDAELDARRAAARAARRCRPRAGSRGS